MPLSRRPRARPAPATVDDPDDVEAATAAALRILRGAAQTELSLRRRLESRGFSDATARAAAVEAARFGYVDDAAFARSLAERRLGRGYGRAAVSRELRARGVGEDPIDTVLRGVGLDDEREAATRLARRLLARERDRRGFDDPRSGLRIAAALARRGFDGGTVRHAVRTAWAGEQSEEAPD
jgi:regulatory protein